MTARKYEKTEIDCSK